MEVPHGFPFTGGGGFSTGFLRQMSGPLPTPAPHGSVFLDFLQVICIVAKALLWPIVEVFFVGTMPAVSGGGEVPMLSFDLTGMR